MNNIKLWAWFFFFRESTPPLNTYRPLHSQLQQSRQKSEPPGVARLLLMWIGRRGLIWWLLWQIVLSMVRSGGHYRRYNPPWLGSKVFMRIRPYLFGFDVDVRDQRLHDQSRQLSHLNSLQVNLHDEYIKTTTFILISPKLLICHQIW